MATRNNRRKLPVRPSLKARQARQAQVKAEKADLCKEPGCGREKKHFNHSGQSGECEGSLIYGCPIHGNTCGACAAFKVLA